MPTFQAPPGTFDVLPPASARYERLIGLFDSLARGAGYGLVVSPMYEDVGVFRRVGESTDLVRKEMYEFTDRGGRHLALRPEGTASVVRAFVQHSPPTPFKAFYVAPHFRQERQQAGRYRQHHQVGVEALGSEDPDLDVEVVALAWRFFEAVGLRRIRLRLTSLGDTICRPAYRDELLAYLKERRDELCDEHAPRLEDSPMRVLDCKREQCRRASAGAPRMLDRLCEPCRAHLSRVEEGLTALGVAYSIDPTLVRGLDYYTRTTFEFEAEALEASQSGAGGGGRYDGLVEELGGPPTPGIGFGLGVERILLAADAEGAFPVPGDLLDAFVIDTTGGATARDLADELRRAGIRADRAFDGRSFRAQMKVALRSGAAFAVVVEPESITIRTLREKGEATAVDRDEVVGQMRKRLG